MSLKSFISSLVHTIATDRQVPHRYVGTYDMLERVYARNADPWRLRTSPFAVQRYLKLLEVLAAHTPCESILEVGCGEGLFTQRLIGLGQRVVGIDVSPTALARARQRVPRATFSCVSLEDFRAEQTFDVVVAVEMLYYVPDVDAALEALTRLGTTVILSYTSRDAARLDPHVDQYGDRAERRFHPFSFWTRTGFTVARILAPVRSAGVREGVADLVSLAAPKVASGEGALGIGEDDELADACG